MMRYTCVCEFRWEELKALVGNRSKTLEDAIEKTNDFHKSWKAEVGWLEDAEQKAYGDWKPCGLPRTCQADVDAHEVCWMEMDYECMYIHVHVCTCMYIHPHTCMCIDFIGR